MKKITLTISLINLFLALAITVKTVMVTETRAENYTIKVDNIRPRRLLTMAVVQNEPAYTPAEEIVSEQPEYNYQKFSNPGGELHTIPHVSSQPYNSASPSPAGVLTKRKGVNRGPSGKETWYNLDMTGVIKIMRSAGYSEAEYPYWVRDDGCKMLGDYIMLAANVFSPDTPRGKILETSLGMGMVCDHCVRALTEVDLIDVATNW